MAVLNTDSQNVQQVNNDVDSMTKQLREMAAMAKTLERNLGDVNNQLTTMSKISKRTGNVFGNAVGSGGSRGSRGSSGSASQSSASTRQARVLSEYEKNAQKINELRMKGVKDDNKGMRKLINQQTKLRIQTEREEKKEAKRPFKSFTKLADKVEGLGLVGTFAALAKIVKSGIDEGKRATESLKDFTKSVNAASGASNYASQYNKEYTSITNRQSANDIAQQIIDNSKAAQRENMFGWAANAVSGAKRSTAELLAGDTLENIAKQQKLTPYANQLYSQGYGTDQIKIMTELLDVYAANTSHGYSQNSALNLAALRQTSEYDTALKQAMSMITGGVDSNIFQGYLAASQGSAYVPSVTRSKEVQANYAIEMLKTLASADSNDARNNLMNQWENAGTVLNKIGQNLYSFDEVISQDAIEVNDKASSEILGNILTNLENKDTILNDMQNDVNGLASLGTEGGSTPYGNNGTDEQGHISLTPTFDEKDLFTSVDEALAYMSGHGATMNDLMAMSTPEVAAELNARFGSQGGMVAKNPQLRSNGDITFDTYTPHGAYMQSPLSVGEMLRNTVDKVGAYDLYQGGARSGFLDATWWAGWLDELFDKLLYSNTSGGGHSFAIGGVGTHRVDGATLFENGAEAVIPLESQAGINYLANAMQQANGGSTGANINVTLELSGINIADNDRQWNDVARQIGERINTIQRREGGI